MTSINRIASLALAGIMGVTAFGSASAAPLAPRISGAVVDGASVENVQYRVRERRGRVVIREPDGTRFVYRTDRYGPRYRVRRPGYTYERGGYYYSRPFWLGAAAAGIVGGAIAGAAVRAEAADDDRHISWCEARYRSYDARSDTFIQRAGYPPVRCISPYS